MSLDGWHDWFLAGSVLTLMALFIAISPYQSAGKVIPLRVRLAAGLGVVAFVMAVILVANLL
jgi:hypothetical protein